MATVFLNPPAGYYKSTYVGIAVVFDTGTVDRYAYSTDPNAPLSVSKYIAYDQLTPPTPFIAVTQDGRGNVVYDGGFPKFYNGQWNNATTFAGLTAACRYLHNAILWCANSAKWNAGNRKILIIDDNWDDGTHYLVKNDTLSDSFNKTLIGVCSIVGAIPTFCNCSDFGDQLNISKEFLDQFAMLIFFGSNETNGVRGRPVITDTTVENMVLFREAGNGIVFITDHGVVYNSLAEARAGAIANNTGSFFLRVNKVAVNFGAYFTGDFNHTPVNVGYIRQNYGDHPLYNGMADTESIAAGDSESQVVVTTSSTFPASQSLSVTALPPITDVSLLAMMKNGTVQSGRFRYILDLNPNFRFTTKEKGTNGVITSNVNSKVTVDWTGEAAGLTVDITAGTYPGTGIPELPWEFSVGLGQDVVGFGKLTSSGYVYSFFNGKQTMPVSAGNAFQIPAYGPTAYIGVPIRNLARALPNSVSQARYAQFNVVTNRLDNGIGFTTKQEGYSIARLHAGNAKWKPPVSIARQHRLMRAVQSNVATMHRGVFNVDVYPTVAACLAYISSNPVAPFCICQANGLYYYAVAGSTNESTNPWWEVFGGNCTLTSTRTGTFEMSASGVLTKA